MLQTPPSAITSSPSSSFAQPSAPSLDPTQILQTATDEVVPGALLLPRIWTWISRLSSNKALMSQSAAPHVLAAILETAGDRAMVCYKGQMAKMCVAIARKCAEDEANAAVGNTGGEDGPIGGHEGEGKAGRVRLALFLEKWQTDGKIAPHGIELMEG